MSKKSQFNVALKWVLSAHPFYSIHTFTFNKIRSACITQQRVLCVPVSCVPMSILKKVLTDAINDFMANSSRRTETIKLISIFVWISPYSCPIFQTWTFSTDFHKTSPIAKLKESSTGAALVYAEAFIYFFGDIHTQVSTILQLASMDTDIRINTVNKQP
jgi:hypothetical protein